MEEISHFSWRPYVIKIKLARGLIYDEVMKQVNILRKKRSQDTRVPLPDITRDGLRKKTQRAEKIYKLLEKIGLDKI
jgi:hypothetical protein